MATYVIGDIQGCYTTFMALLEKIAFNPKNDTLWLAGDLINRGKGSLEVLRFAYQMRERVITVMGNHDMHLLAVYYGATAHKSYDTLDDILQASDCDELCYWLRQQPLLHHDERLNFVLTHAGIHPQWDIQTAEQCAHEVEASLQGEMYKEFLHHMYGNQPEHWDTHLQGWERLRFITNVFTRMRLVSETGRLDLRKKGSPEGAQEHYHPWFSIRPRLASDVRIIFGHWAALECNTGDEPNVYAIDSGCVWGNKLTAFRLDDLKRFRVKNREPG
ncbi:MAG: symmetrical bis(5'-nucleosyl)-tetraphosphatase [Legionellales bacterium]|nr:symmetrical bis(5'-nucleosyl)-tetraphosphatase [Legionellales bacterium]